MTFVVVAHWMNPLVWYAFARMRADHSALRRGVRSNVGATTDTFVYRMQDDFETVHVALNRGDLAFTVTSLPVGTYEDLLTGELVPTPVKIPARSARILIKQ